jgi:hypothetical protein
MTLRKRCSQVSEDIGTSKQVGYKQEMRHCGKKEIMADILFRNPYKTETILDEQEIKFTDERKLGKCQNFIMQKERFIYFM